METEERFIWISLLICIFLITYSVTVREILVEGGKTFIIDHSEYKCKKTNTLREGQE